MFHNYTQKRYEGQPSEDPFVDWMVDLSETEAPEPNVDVAWDKLQAKIGKPAKKVSIFTRSLRIAAGLALLAVGSYLVIDQMQGDRMTEVVAHKGTMDVLLPDGSSVVLGAGSAISFPETFDDDTRSVTLTGEAYFDVQKNESPFVISTGDIDVRVLGTAFNVNSTKDVVSVYVEHGLVAMERNDQQFKIAPSQMGIYKKSTREIRIDTTPSPNVMSWRTGVFEFDQTPLEDVVQDLGRFYDVSFKVSSNMKSCRVTAKFDNADLNEVVRVLRTILSAEIVTSPTEVKIKGKGCQ